MVGETQAPGPEQEGMCDPLHLQHEAKSPYLDYQWHSTSKFALHPRQFAEDTGWVPVARDSMPGEPSQSADYIQRGEMRLFFRLRRMSDEARDRDTKTARTQLAAMDDARLKSGVPVRVPDRPPFKTVVPRSEWTRPRSRVEKSKRGRLLVVHEATIGKKIGSWMDRHQWRLLRFRVVYFSRAESDMSGQSIVSVPDWAWAKIDLHRAGIIPWKRG